MGQPPGLLFIHTGDDLSKTIHHVLKRVDVVVENDDFGFRIALSGFLPLQKRRRRRAGAGHDSNFQWCWSKRKPR